ncbi:RNA polymerase sigma factor SigZ [Paenibacillus alginolyticus]|uniref:RNA polymerase sigma factor SigZ n=1 Tax=Paenibacillus alginolyticus TaxID=59839 RepID=A0ABT4GJY7_9BACL|nr:RNA polymerase sigma factor SigZ [Paenibacillus alginolyticus]MCY9696509.1 RNA polymerase sigma factor SigZ [Paenibacillus alginolyticus]MEC0144686.1 RNA polymerase sigma factor SigZ [Paenibacillus alginolyticus]
MKTEELWLEFSTELLTFIQMRVRNEFDAEDILQDVFRKIHLSIHTLSDESKIQSWMYQITRNAITDYYRTSARRNGIETHFDDEIKLMETEEVSNLNNLVSGWLTCIAQALDEKYREAILLTELGVFTQKQLAERLGISVSGAKSRVQRGREKIKEMLLACCHIERDRLGNVIDYQRKSASCNCNLC